MMMTQVAHPVSAAAITNPGGSVKLDNGGVAGLMPLDVNEQKMWWQLEEVG